MEQSNPQLSDGATTVADESLDELIARARAEGHPWAEAAGVFKDDALFDDWVEAMRENRRKEDMELGVIEYDDPEDPARRFAGILCDNPLYEPWQEVMRENRRQADGFPEAR